MDKYYMRFAGIVSIILIALMVSFCGFPVKVRQTCGTITTIRGDGAFQVKFLAEAGQSYYTDWFTSSQTDTLKVNQTVCLK